MTPISNPIATPVGLAGPGSQPPEEDGPVLDCLALPKGMDTYCPPRLPELEVLPALRPALSLLERLLAALAVYRVGDLPAVLDLSTLDQPNRALLEQTLGEGEVTGTLTGLPGQCPTSIRETRLAGVWWLRRQDPSGVAWELDHLEVADLPVLVRAMAFDGATDRLCIPAPLPPGVMNAPGVLAEVNAQVAGWQAGHSAHIVNLSLLPQTSEDRALLDAVLGAGRVFLSSRGYGTCRVTSTRLQNCWRVRHFNSEGRPILDSIEVTEAPVAVLAAQEDIADSAVRLGEILAVLGGRG